MAPLDLAPARWIWLPLGRTLANTFALFRRSFFLDAIPEQAPGWISADSRYRLWVNGQRVQEGPAPFDPRHAEADPVDLRPFLREGENVIGIEALFYGHGEGTWPFGCPGVIARFEVGDQLLATDESWRCLPDRARPAGQYRRWYLRALQEVFDSRAHPHGWSSPDFDDDRWYPAKPTGADSSGAALSSRAWDYAGDTRLMDGLPTTLRARTVPLPEFRWFPAKAERAGEVLWHRPVDDWFDFRLRGAMEVRLDGEVPARWPATLPATPPGRGHVLTTCLEREVVGHPEIEWEAPAGTVLELIFHEAHRPDLHPWMDSHFYQWARVIARGGREVFRCFEYESLRWIQLHLHEASGPVTIHRVGVSQRRLPGELPVATSEDPLLDRLLLANAHTLENCAIETVVDGMGRERQQYSGDCTHALRYQRLLRGDATVAARFLRTYAQGQLYDGVFADSWPGQDRLQRLWQKPLGLSGWGSILDHGVGFVMDHHRHAMESGDLSPFEENFDRLRTFLDFLRRLSAAAPDGLLPVEDLGPWNVWIDHDAFSEQRQKQAAFNLYAASAVLDGWAPLCSATGHDAAAEVDWAQGLVRGVIERFYCPDRRLLVNNLPWRRPGEPARVDDRSLSHAVLMGVLPAGPEAALDTLEAAESRPDLAFGLSYPANAVWRLWALAKGRRVPAILRDLESRWGPMLSVSENATLQEHWTAEPDTMNLMSHCPMGPYAAFVEGVLGFEVLEPGATAVRLDVRPESLAPFHLELRLPLGTLSVRWDGAMLHLEVPPGVRVERPG